MYGSSAVTLTVGLYLLLSKATQELKEVYKHPSVVPSLCECLAGSASAEVSGGMLKGHLYCLHVSWGPRSVLTQPPLIACMHHSLYLTTSPHTTYPHSPSPHHHTPHAITPPTLHHHTHQSPNAYQVRQYASVLLRRRLVKMWKHLQESEKSRYSSDDQTYLQTETHTVEPVCSGNCAMQPPVYSSHPPLVQ